MFSSNHVLKRREFDATFVRQTSCAYRCDPPHTAADLRFSAARDGRLMAVTYSKTEAPSAARCAVTYHVAPAAAGEAAITDLSTGGC
jgi:hypothetical protein